LTPDVETRRQTLFGRVRSVHRAAVYVDLEAPPGALVIAIESVGGLPAGILVRGSTNLVALGVRRGMSFEPTRGGWSIPSAGIRIDATGAATWSPALPRAARLVRGPDLARRVAVAGAIASRSVRSGGLWPSEPRSSEEPWLIRARGLIDALLDGLRNDDGDRAAKAAVGLVGLGIGLTPSGDDYLVGMLAGLEAARHPLHDLLAAAVADDVSARTTSVGAASLTHASHGAFPERLHDVLVAVAGAGATPGDLVRAVEQAMEFGATSGSDTLAGLFAALDLPAAADRSERRAA
jgi:Protein of unknown function (DUF2877)